MHSITSIHVDRLAAALGKQGPAPKRSKVAEALATTFGYADSNVLAVAAGEGALDLPHASLGGVEGGMATLVDPVAGLPFSLSATVLRRRGRDRASDLIVSPYGNLLDVGQVRDALAVDAGTVKSEAGPAPSPGDADDPFSDLALQAHALSASQFRVTRIEGGVAVFLRSHGVDVLHRTLSGSGADVVVASLQRHAEAARTARTLGGGDGSVSIPCDDGTLRARIRMVQGDFGGYVVDLPRDDAAGRVGSLGSLGIRDLDAWRSAWACPTGSAWSADRGDPASRRRSARPSRNCRARDVTSSTCLVSRIRPSPDGRV